MTSIVDASLGLPYPRLLARWLRPIQRAFLVVNAIVVAPALRLGLGRMIGNPATGRLLLLRTRGRRTGRIREVPLGYVIRDGAAWCVAGYGRSTPWFWNLLADPRVEVVLPDRRFAGTARAVDDPAQWAAAYRDLVASFGLLGRLAVGSLDRMSDTELVASHAALPIVRIDPVDPPGPLRPGIWDRGPAGSIVLAGWLMLIGAALLAGVRAGARGLLRGAPGRGAPARAARGRAAPQRCRPASGDLLDPAFRP